MAKPCARSFQIPQCGSQPCHRETLHRYGSLRTLIPARKNVSPSIFRPGTLSSFSRSIERLATGKTAYVCPLKDHFSPATYLSRLAGNSKFASSKCPACTPLWARAVSQFPFPYDEMEALRRGVGLLNVEPHPFVRAGERALIRRGPLEGITGIVMRQKNKINVRVILSIDLIMKSISVEVAAEDLEIAGQDCSTYEYVLP